MKHGLHNKSIKLIINTTTCLICIASIVLGTVHVSAADASTSLQTNTVKIARKSDPIVVIDGDYTAKDFNGHKGNSYYFDHGTPNQIKATCTIFESSYLVVLSWNLVEKQYKNRYTKEWFTSSYDTSKSLMLDDKSKVKIYYESDCKKEKDNKEFDKVLPGILKGIKDKSLYEPFPIDNVLIRDVKKIDKSKYSSLAKENYDKKNYGMWYAFYCQLGNKDQENYRTKIINSANNTALRYILDDLSDKQIEEYFKDSYEHHVKKLYSVIIDYLDTDIVDEYFTKAYEDKYTDFMKEAICCISDQLLTKLTRESYDDNDHTSFELLFDELECKEMDKYIEKIYKDNRISYFKGIIDYLSCEGYDEYLEKSYKDNKTKVFKLLIDEACEDTIDYYYKKAKKANKKQFIDLLEDYR